MEQYSFLAADDQMYKSYKSVNKNTISSPDCVVKGDDDLPRGENFLRSCALKLAQRREYHQAIALLSGLIDCYPDNAVDYNNRGLIYFQSGQIHKAFCDYNTALQLNPSLASAYNNRANYYAACGNLIVALTDYDQALDLNPRNVRAWINRAITLRDLSQYEESLENFEIALLLGQLTGHIWAGRGRTYHLWGDWNCAIADYQRALKQISSLTDSEDIDSYRYLLQAETWLNELLHPQQ